MDRDALLSAFYYSKQLSSAVSDCRHNVTGAREGVRKRKRERRGEKELRVGHGVAVYNPCRMSNFSNAVTVHT